jgi:serine/threonine-protein kinase RsbW
MLKIPSETIHLVRIEQFVKKIFIKFDIDEKLFAKILLCLNEAVRNAIEHGNRFDKEKCVFIQSYVLGEFIYFKVKDQGNGFNYHSIPDPTLSENIKNESGRGIHIIRNICETTNFRKNGNVIEFKFKTKRND